MKIGIVIREPKFQESGGGTFVKSILKEAKQSLKDKKYEYIFCYRGKATKRWKTVKDGNTYINITAFNVIRTHKLIYEGLRNTARNCKRRFQQKRPIQSEVSFWDLLAKEESVDLYWFTFPEDEVVSTPYIYTLWDLGHRTVPMLPEVSSSIYEWESREQMYSRTVYRASYILTGNETGRNEIVDNYAVPKEKVRIVPFPISDFCYGDEKKPDKELPNQYFFYPATFWPHKNHVCIIEALSILKKNYGKKINVVFSGGASQQQLFVREFAKRMDVADQIMFLGFVSDEQIRYLYTHAYAMIYASLMGPNNLPPLEAAYLGCPVIITDLAGHKEQMGDSAIYFDGLDASSLGEAIIKITDDESLRESLINKEKKLMQDYNKKKYIDYVIDIFNEFEEIHKRWCR